MSEDTQKLQILVGLYELAISRLFEMVPGGDDAKRQFVQDVQQVLDSTNELQRYSSAAQTYSAATTPRRSATRCCWRPGRYSHPRAGPAASRRGPVGGG